MLCQQVFVILVPPDEVIQCSRRVAAVVLVWGVKTRGKCPKSRKIRPPLPNTNRQNGLSNGTPFSGENSELLQSAPNISFIFFPAYFEEKSGKHYVSPSRGNTVLTPNGNTSNMSVCDGGVMLAPLVNRSPMLATLSGTACAYVLALTTICVLFVTDPKDVAAVEIINFPMIFFLFVGGYGMRGFRLVVMYNQKKRERWGKYIKEATMAKLLLAGFIVIEVIAWTVVPAVGVER